MDICWDYMEVTERKDPDPCNGPWEGTPASSVLDADCKKRLQNVIEGFGWFTPKRFIGVPAPTTKEEQISLLLSPSLGGQAGS